MTPHIRNQIKIDRANPTPLYFQIETALQRLLDNGVLRPGDKFPGDIELCEALQVNRGTVRKAIAGLVRKGRLMRRKRAGTFVRDTSQGSVPTIGFFYFYESAQRMILRAEQIQRRCAPHGFDLKVVAFERDYYDRTDLLGEMRRRGLCGAVLVPLRGDNCLTQLRRLEAERFPYVRMGAKAFTGQLTAPLVTGDDRGAALDALQRLWDLERRAIGLISKHHWSESVDAYRLFSQTHRGIDPRWQVVAEFDGTLEGWKRFPAAQVVRAYLERFPELTAVIVEHSLTGVAALHQAQDIGRRVPQDLSLIALETYPGVEVTTPPLTTMNVSDAAEGEACVELLLDIIAHGPKDREIVQRVPYKFIDRESVAAPRRP